VILAIAVINIFLGVAVTSWTFVNQRDRESELIWRGEQYSRALQCFIEANGVPPMELEELVEANCIRRLYPDPMNASGEWRLLRAADLGEEFAGLLAGLAGGSDPVGAGAGPEAGGGPDSGDEPRGAGNPEGSRSGLGQSSLLDRLRNSRSKTGSQSGQRGGGSGAKMGFGMGRPGAQSGGGSQAEQGGGPPEQGSLRERAQSRLRSKLAKRNLTGRRGRGAGDIDSVILGVATSTSGEAIRAYGDKSRYEEWYFTLASKTGQSGSGGSLPLSPGGAPSIDPASPDFQDRVDNPDRTRTKQSRTRRPVMRRGG
jgi:type II secretory pathway pseudopilin PulG